MPNSHTAQSEHLPAGLGVILPQPVSVIADRLHARHLRHELKQTPSDYRPNTAVTLFNLNTAHPPAVARAHR